MGVGFQKRSSLLNVFSNEGQFSEACSPAKELAPHLATIRRRASTDARDQSVPMHAADSSIKYSRMRSCGASVVEEPVDVWYEL
jgi:hypothetical protein